MVYRPLGESKRESCLLLLFPLRLVKLYDLSGIKCSFYILLRMRLKQKLGRDTNQST